MRNKYKCPIDIGHVYESRLAAELTVDLLNHLHTLNDLDSGFRSGIMWEVGLMGNDCPTVSSCANWNKSKTLNQMMCRNASRA